MSGTVESLMKVAEGIGAAGIVLGTCSAGRDGALEVELRFVFMKDGGAGELRQRASGGRGRIFAALRRWADSAHFSVTGRRIPEYCPKITGNPACAKDFRIKTDPAYKFIDGNRDFMIRAWHDRNGADREPPAYRDGERIRLYIQAERDCHVYLMGIDAVGDIKPLFADSRKWPVRIEGGKVYAVPGETFSFELVARGRQGLERIIVLGTAAPVVFDRKLKPVDSKGNAIKKDAADFLNELSFLLNQPGKKGAVAAAAEAKYFIE